MLVAERPNSVAMKGMAIAIAMRSKYETMFPVHSMDRMAYLNFGRNVCGLLILGFPWLMAEVWALTFLTSASEFSTNSHELRHARESSRSSEEERRSD